MSFITTLYFSKDRPMQLDLAIRSNFKYCDEKETPSYVLYDASNERFEKAYDVIKKEYPKIHFVKEIDFKKDLLNILKDTQYVLFIVDDTVFVKKYSLKDILAVLYLYRGTLGFSLRLGKNTKICYPKNKEQSIASMMSLDKDIAVFNWLNSGEDDFSYPLEVSSSIYRMKDIKRILEEGNYNSPNSLEWIMYNNLKNFKNFPFMGCYRTSVAFSNPINKIQEENNNRVGDNPDYKIEALLEKFEQGYRIDLKPFEEFVPNGCHQEVDIEFIKED